MTSARFRPMRSPILLLIRMNAAETNASRAMADCTALAVVLRSLVTAEIDTFMSEVSTTNTNIAIESSTISRRLPEPATSTFPSASVGPIYVRLASPARGERRAELPRTTPSRSRRPPRRRPRSTPTACQGASLLLCFGSTPQWTVAEAEGPGLRHSQPTQAELRALEALATERTSDSDIHMCAGDEPSARPQLAQACLSSSGYPSPPSDGDQVIHVDIAGLAPQCGVDVAFRDQHP